MERETDNKNRKQGERKRGNSRAALLQDCSPRSFASLEEGNLLDEERGRERSEVWWRERERTGVRLEAQCGCKRVGQRNVRRAACVSVSSSLSHTQTHIR